MPKDFLDELLGDLLKELDKERAKAKGPKNTHTIAARFRDNAFNWSDKTYYYLTHQDDINIGDYIILSHFKHNGPVFAHVVDIWHNTKLDGAVKWVLGHMPAARYEHQLQWVRTEEASRDRVQKRVTELKSLSAARKQKVSEKIVDNYLKDDTEYKGYQTELKYQEELLASLG